MLLCHKVETRFAVYDVLFQHKAAGVKQLAKIDIAVNDGINRRPGINARQPFAQFFGVAGNISFGQQNAVCIAYLRLGDGELIHLLVGMDRIHQGDHAIQQIALAKHLVGEKGLDNRPRVGHAGAFNHQPVELDFTAVAAVEQIEQGVFQFVGARTADAAVGQGFNLRGAVADQLIVNGDFAKFIFNHGDFKAVLFVENMAQQGGFTCAEKTGE